MLSTLLLNNPQTFALVPTRSSLIACAKWNEKAAKRSSKAGDHKAAKRQLKNADNLRKQAKHASNN
jgi:hypothetical protein